jgi:Ni/Fe-hydrogenase subunit HybB-like protein
MTVKTATKEKAPIPVAYLILGAVVVFGAILGIIRLALGLGATTNLSNYYPWGLWIAFDFFAVPFSGGAFTLAAVLHIFNRKKYHGIAHLALLAGFLGYLMVVLVLVMDINRWDQFFNVLLPWNWNLHSFMFEVAMSITLYFMVLALELVPIVFGRKNWLVVQVVNQLIPFIAGVGILLSTVHQSSIGAIFLILAPKLHPLWWSPIIPLFFFTSAVFSGLSVAILLALISWRALRMPAPMPLLSNLAKAAAVVMGIYLALKIGDLLLAGDMGLVLGSGAFSVLYLVEIVVGVIAPLAIFASRARETTRGLLAGTICALTGLAINRSTNAWFALRAASGATYLPSWIEIGITVAAVCAGILFFAMGLRSLPTLREGVSEEGH